MMITAVDLRDCCVYIYILLCWISRIMGSLSVLVGPKFGGHAIDI